MSLPALRDRARGLLLALACGDALGAPLEFSRRDSRPPVTGFEGGGHFGLQPGQWTDDTAMAMCLAESLAECGGFDAADQMARYLRWLRHGHWSSRPPDCVGIGRTTERAIRRFEASGRPWAGADECDAPTNGSVMRLAPVALRWLAAPAEVLRRHCADSSRTTHGAPQAVQACQLLGQVLQHLLRGGSRHGWLYSAAQWARDAALHAELQPLAAGHWRTLPRHAIDSSGLAVPALQAALWCFHQADSLPQALCLAANLGDDADTVAAITGQLAGAHWGASAIPADWLAQLHRRDDIAAMADRLLDQALAEAEARQPMRSSIATPFTPTTPASTAPIQPAVPMAHEITLYGIPNCDTVKRARAWLTAQGVVHQFHDFKKAGVPEAGLTDWLAAAGWERLLNRKGTMWRQLDDAQRAAVVDASSAAALMRQVPSVIKRPVVRWADGRITVGFDEAVFAAHRG